MIAILLALLINNDTHALTIYIDQSVHSKMIVTDLTYDWTERIDNQRTKRFKEIQTQIKPRIVLVDVTTREADVLKHTYYEKYPAFRYGVNNPVEYLDERMYMMQSFPLLTLETFLNKIDFSTSEYIRKCSEAEDNVAKKYSIWLSNNKPKEYEKFIQGLYEMEIYELPGYFQLKKFEGIKGMPVFKPDYPVRPRIWYPWEKEYELYPNNTLVDFRQEN